MIWAHIRFEVDDRGGYDDRWVILPSDGDVVAGTVAAAALCAGYAIGCGRRAILNSIDTVSHENALTLTPDAVVGQHNRIASLGRRV